MSTTGTPLPTFANSSMMNSFDNMAMSDPGPLERLLLPVVKPGQARDFDFDEQQSTIHFTDKIGLTVQSESEESDKGVFIVGVATGGAAAAADGHALVVGMRIMELDGTRLEKAKKDKVIGIMKAATDTLLVKAKYDPEGFADIDQGVELRRMKNYAFHHQWEGVNEGQIFEAPAQYCGSQPIQTTTLQAAKAAAKKLGKRVTAASEKLELTVLRSAMVARPPPKDRFDALKCAAIHTFVDCAAIFVNGKVLVMLTMDQAPGEVKRTLRCHAYLFKRKSEATALMHLIELRLATGRDHMHNTMTQKTTPPVLENMASGPDSRDPEKVAAQLLAFYGKHAPGTKSKEGLLNVIDKCVAEGFEWLDEPLKKKYNESFSEFNRNSAQLPSEAPGSEDPQTFGFGDEADAMPNVAAGIKDKAAYVAQLMAYYERHAPGTKSEADLDPVTTRCANIGTDWLNAPLKKKYGQSMDEFLLTGGADWAVTVELDTSAQPDETEFGGFEEEAAPAPAPDPGVEKYLDQLMAYYDQNAPGTKTRDELRPVAEKCRKDGHEWLDGPLQKKYGIRFSSFLEPEPARFDEPEEDPKVAKITTQLLGFYAKHAPNTKTAAELEPVARKCATEGIGWLNAPLKKKYGESMDEFLTPPSTAAAADPQVLTMLSHLVAYYSKHGPGTKSMDDLTPIAAKCAKDGTGWLDGPLKKKYGESMTEFLAPADKQEPAGFDEPEPEPEAAADPVLANYLTQLVAYYAKHAPGTKAADDLTPAAEKCAKEGHNWLEGPLKKKYGESMSEFLASREPEPTGFDEPEPEPEPESEAPLDSTQSKCLTQLLDYYAKHAFGSKSEADLTPVAVKCAQDGLSWLDGPLKRKYGESMTEFLAPAPVEANPDVVDSYVRNLMDYYSTYAPGTKTEQALKPVAEKCAKEGSEWLNGPLKKKYGLSYADFVSQAADPPTTSESLPVTAASVAAGKPAGSLSQLETVNRTSKSFMQLMLQLGAYYEKHAPGTKSDADLTPVAEKCVSDGTAWMNDPLQKKYGESLDAFVEVDRITKQLMAFYGKHAPGSKSQKDLIPVAQRCAELKDTAWLDGPLSTKYGQSLHDFVFDLDQKQLEILEHLVAFYEKHAAGTKTLAELEPVAERCARTGIEWLNPLMTRRYGQSLTAFIEEQGSHNADEQFGGFDDVEPVPFAAAPVPAPQPLQIVCFPNKGLGARQGGGLHEKSRTGIYPFSDVARSPVPDDKVAWSVPYSEYDPPDYCAPVCMKEDSFWSDQNSSKGIIHNAGCTPADNVDRISHVATYTVDPATNLGFNPCGRTGIKGQGVLGRFGPNHAADPVVTRWKRNKDYTIVQDQAGKPVLEWISIQRTDTGAWAIPGGFVDPGEGISLTLKREFGEEALNTLLMTTAEKEEAWAGIQDLWDQGVMMYQGYMDDSRNTDNAWIETICYNFHDKSRCTDRLPLKAGDDAKSVRWCAYVAGNPDGLKLHAGHVTLIEQTYLHVLDSSPPDSETLEHRFVTERQHTESSAESTSKLRELIDETTASVSELSGGDEVDAPSAEAGALINLLNGIVADPPAAPSISDAAAQVNALRKGVLEVRAIEEGERSSGEMNADTVAAVQARLVVGL